MASTLEEVEATQTSKRPVAFSNMKVFVVNYDAPGRFPKKFIYKGCTVNVGSRRPCSLSLENDTCQHDPTGKDFSYFFRFDVFLVDGSMGGMPIRATLFNTACTLLGIHPLEFKVLSEPRQIRRVSEIIGCLPMCEVCIRVGNGSAIVQSLAHLPYPTSPPRQLKSDVHCEGTAISGGASSSGARTKRLSGCEGDFTGNDSGVEAKIETKDEGLTVKRAVKYLSAKFLGLYGSDGESDDEK